MFCNLNCIDIKNKYDIIKIDDFTRKEKKKMKKVFKLVVIVLAMCLLINVFTACGESTRRKYKKNPER